MVSSLFMIETNGGSRIGSIVWLITNPLCSEMVTMMDGQDSMMISWWSIDGSLSTVRDCLMIRVVMSLLLVKKSRKRSNKPPMARRSLHQQGHDYISNVAIFPRQARVRDSTQYRLPQATIGIWSHQCLFSHWQQQQQRQQKHRQP